MTFEIAVVSRNTDFYLYNLLVSIRDRLPPEAISCVHVWDNGSDDATLPMLERFRSELPGLEIHASPSNDHHGPALDALLRHACKSEWILLLDSDTEVRRHLTLPRFRRDGAPGADYFREIERRGLTWARFRWTDFIEHFGQGTLREMHRRGERNNELYRFAARHLLPRSLEAERREERLRDSLRNFLSAGFAVRPRSVRAPRWLAPPRGRDRVLRRRRRLDGRRSLRRTEWFDGPSVSASGWRRRRRDCSSDSCGRCARGGCSRSARLSAARCTSGRAPPRPMQCSSGSVCRAGSWMIRGNRARSPS